MEGIHFSYTNKYFCYNNTLLFLSTFTGFETNLRSSGWEGLELMNENSLKRVPNKRD